MKIFIEQRKQHFYKAAEFAFFSSRHRWGLWANDRWNNKLMFEQHKIKQQNSDHRSHANVFGAFQNRVGVHNKLEPVIAAKQRKH